MSHKQKRNILGLEPITPYDDNRLLADPFAAVYSTLTKKERALVDTGSFQIVAARAQQVKASLVAAFMQNLGADITEIFAQRTE